MDISFKGLKIGKFVLTHENRLRQAKFQMEEDELKELIKLWIKAKRNQRVTPDMLRKKTYRQ